MAYGFKITNGAGRNIIYGVEECPLYWGRVTVSAAYNSGHKLYSLFNIPVSWKPIVFARLNYDTLSGSNYGPIGFGVGVTQASGRLRGYTNIDFALSGSVSVTFYVFVPARYVPRPGYGMALYNDSGILAFHNGRKSLNVRAIATRTDGSFGFNSAIACGKTGFVAYGEDWSRTTYGYTDSIIGRGTGTRWLWEYIGSNPGYFHHGEEFGPIRAPVINVDEYNSVPNLGSV